VTFIAKASRTVRLPRADCYARFVDYPSWKSWMPASFRPMRGPPRDLEMGDRFWVALRPAPAGVSLPAVVRVVRANPGVEVAWRGGLPGVLTGEHAFLFEDQGDGATLVRSEETWRGVLAGFGPLARSVQKGAERIGADQLAAFATWVRG
jgi:hypothetical protein